jgi:hypothetical protein
MSGSNPFPARSDEAAGIVLPEENCAMKDLEYFGKIASLTGLQYYPGKGPWGKSSGAVMGVRDGYVTVVGPERSDNTNKIIIITRFKNFTQPELLKAALKDSTNEFLKKHGSLGKIGSDFVRWEWKYSFSKPKPEEVSQLVNSLRDAIKPVAPGFDGRCEQCQSTSAQELTLMNGLPFYICPGCQERVRHELDQAAMRYEAIEPNYPNGLALGIGAAILGGIAWGGVAYAINRIFLYGSILIGYFVSWAVVKGTRKVTLFGQIVAPILTVASVLFGDAIFYVLAVMKQENIPFSMKLMNAILTNLLAIEKEGNGILTVIFALVGAGFALFARRKPKFQATFEPLGSPSAPAA